MNLSRFRHEMLKFSSFSLKSEGFPFFLLNFAPYNLKHGDYNK